ncbi:hypothetical protein BBF96_00820 [Anoxybacter fermentans]|uniref:Alkyl hydroperoxide reductase subunit C/ Thiol specific antioxidant domain-containing protein n=1 Tax=Anoxybacter fermentans TaxID=1323375 RepID=A0A3Q9HNF9_9FIRM|nr:hypothetical protein [Anoxybacter fermentans]AZR72059.1 hypothetical protein BBF96_00820 [Anoxybacter fermentans]
MKKISLKFNLKQFSITLILFIFFFIILNIITPRYKELVYHPLPTHQLKNLSGEIVDIPTQFPNKDYLILFFIDTSPTSLKQLNEITKIASEIPDNIAIILIHIGRMNRPLPFLNKPEFNFFIDFKAELAQKMGIYIVPTLILLTNSQYEIFYFQELISSEQLMTYFKEKIEITTP